MCPNEVLKKPLVSVITLQVEALYQQPHPKGRGMLFPSGG
jgi:hypothetical protein